MKQSFSKKLRFRLPHASANPEFFKKTHFGESFVKDTFMMSKNASKLWTGALNVQKYPDTDTCGRSIRKILEKLPTGKVCCRKDKHC